MADLNQLYDALRKADASGNVEDAKRLASYIRQVSGQVEELEPQPTQDTGFFDMSGRALKRGFKQTGSLLGDVLPAMVGKAVGADEYAARQMQEAAETQEEIRQKYAPRYGQLSDVKGIGDVLPFIAETALEQVPNLATAIVPGVGGAVTGGRIAAQQALKTAGAREVSEEAAKRYAAMASTKGAQRGGLGGAFLGSYALNAPEIFQNIYEETKDPETGEGQMEIGASLLAGSVSAALDSILPAYLVRQFTPGMKMGLVEKVLERSGMQPGLARGAAAGAITGFATEAPTEATQEAISIAAEKFVQENPELWGSKEFNRLVEAGVRGGVGGGAISGVAGGVKGFVEGRPAPTVAPAGAAGPNALDQLDAGEIEEVTPAAPTEVITPAQPKPPEEPTATPELKKVQSDIAAVRGAIRDLEERGTDEAILTDWYAEKDRLEAIERAMRRGEAPEGGVLRAGPGMGPKKLGERRTYKLTPAERAVTEEDLKAAGFMPNDIKRIMFNAKPESASPLAKETLGRVADGQILFGTELRAVTPEDVENAQTEQERNRLEAALARVSQKRLFAPTQQQLGLDLEAAEEGVSRDFASPIDLSQQEFELTAPEGVAPAEVQIETEEGPPAAPMNLVDKTTDRLETLLNNLQPSVQAEQGVRNFGAAITNFIDEVRQYLDTANPEQRKENLGAINEFFNRLGLTSDQQLAQGIVADLKGKNAADQAQIIASRTRMPNITTPTGLSELRNMFQDFMEQQNIAKLGEFPGTAAVRSFANDIYVPAQVANLLRQIRGKSEKFMTPEEKAFMAYMSKWKYGLAMRSAAYDIANGVPMGDMFSGQGAKAGALFQKFVEENFPAQIFTAFNETIAEYKNAQKQAAIAAERIQTRQNQRKAYMQQLASEMAEADAEMRRQKKLEEKRRSAEALAGKETERMEDIRKSLFRATSPANNFIPMHPAIEQQLADGDIDGALSLIEQFPGAAYWKLLARRIRKLNLDTTSQFDAQDRLMRFDLAKIKASVDSLVENIRDAYPDIFATNIEPAINEYGEIDVRTFAKGLKDIKDGNLLGENFSKSSQLDWILDRYEKAVLSIDAPGFYMFDTDTDVINLNRNAGGNSYYAFFHELIHAATANAIRNPTQLNPAQKQALDNLNDLYAYARENYPVLDSYGFTSLDEFIAEAFSNSEFQSLLRTLKYQNSDSSLWSKFIDYVRRLLGGKDTVLFGTLANADILMSAATNRGTKNPLDITLNAGAAPRRRPKSTTAGTFRPSPLPSDMRGPQEWLNSVLSSRPSWSSAKGKIGGFLENLDDTVRKHYLGAFTLRQLQDLIGGRLGDAAQNFINAIESMLEDRNAILDKVSKIQTRWAKFQDQNPDQNKALSLLMIDTTLAAYDPAITTRGNPDLDARWNALSPEAKEIYKEVRDFYKERINEYRNTMMRNVELSMVAQNKTPQEIRVVLNRLQQKFSENTIEPYFPLKRFGRFWFQIGTNPGETREFYMFDSAEARNTFAKEEIQRLQAANDTRGVDAGQNLKDFASKNLQDLQMLNEIEQIIDETGANDPAMSNAALRDALKDNLEQLYYLTLPDRSVRKSFINRKQISGASQDMLRAFVDSSFHMAYQQSRFKYARSMFEQLRAAEALRKSKPLELQREKTIDEDYIAELSRRLEYVMNPTDTGTLPSLLSNVSFLWYLTAPASALVNMLGVPAIGFPVLSARFGKTKAAGTILGYSKKFMRTGFKDADGNFAMPSVGRGDLDAREQAAYDTFVASGLIDITQSHDLAGVAEAPSNLYSGRMNTIMKGASAMFHHAERFNREVIAMSAYKMAYDRAIAAGDPPFVAFNKAVAQAKDLTYRAMFDYSTLNKPRYLQGAYAKVILQFKQFPQQMTYLLARSGFEWFDNLTEDQIATIRENIMRERTRYGQGALSEAELNAAVQNEIAQLKKEGRDRLMGTLGMTFLVAGATGMPLFSVGSAVIESLYAAFSDDDEPPLNFENWFKNWMAQTFGDFWGDSISRGLVTQATGMNIADRMSLNDLWFRDARKSQDEVTAFQNMIINLLGPTAALGISGAEAVKLFNDGQYYRGTEKIMPAVLRQPMVGMRYATEGALTLKGDELVSDISAKDALSQSIGFSPERVAQRQKANIEKKSAEQDIINKRQDLLNAFFMGFDTNDNDLTDRVLDKIDRFNSMYPSYPITGQTITRSIKTRYRARALAEMSGGVPINKNLMDTLEEMGYYGE